MKRLIFLLAAMAVSAGFAATAVACTGISFTAQDGSRVVARTVEWAATPMQCGYVVSPRGHVFQSYTPTGKMEPNTHPCTASSEFILNTNRLSWRASMGRGLQPDFSSSPSMGSMHLTIQQTTIRLSATCSSSHGYCHSSYLSTKSRPESTR